MICIFTLVKITPPLKKAARYFYWMELPSHQMYHEGISKSVHDAEFFNFILVMLLRNRFESTSQAPSTNRAISTRWDSGGINGKCEKVHALVMPHHGRRSFQFKYTVIALVTLPFVCVVLTLDV